MGGSLLPFFAYYDRNKETKLFVNASMEKGATVSQMNDALLELESYLGQFDKIKKYTSRIYSGDYAQIEISFKDRFSESEFPFILKSRLTQKALDLGGISWSIYGVGNGFNSRSQINEPVNFSVVATGYNYEELNIWAKKLKTNIEKHARVQKAIIKESNYWGKQSHEYRFILDKEQLALVNVTSLNLMNNLKNLTLSKNEGLNLNIQGKNMPIRFEEIGSKYFDVWHIKNTPLDSINKPILLKEIASVVQGLEEDNIYKENQEFIRLVEFQYNGAAKFGEIFLTKTLEELAVKLPIGYSFKESDNSLFLFNQDKNNDYVFLLLVALSIIYLICAILFESFKQPFIILSIIPISFIGVFLTFYLFDFNFDQGGLASFLLLSGITVNASIYIINEFNKLKKINPDANKLSLYIDAFKLKIFPIMLTITSTILGFIPFVKDGQNEVFWFALGAGTIGGLLFSLIGILFYLPIFTLTKLDINKK